MTVATVISLSMLSSGCKKTPDDVLNHEEMASLMADIHIGEAVVDFNHNKFPNDSTRKLLKQSIYASHNVSAETVDTSYVWYGNHIEDYIKVYERTIEIIEDRQKTIAKANISQISVAGDSVEVWRGPRPFMVNADMPSRILTFNLMPDSTWHKDDVYMLAYKPINSTGKISARIIIDYSNGISTYVNEPNASSNTNSLKIAMDSTLTPLRVYGYMVFSPENNTAYEVDSIALTRVRRHLLKNNYIPAFIFSTKPKITEKDDDSKDKSSNDRSERTNRKTSATARKVRTTKENLTLPKSSADGAKKSEHRKDAIQHKPTPEQRREANRRRNENAVPMKRIPAKENNAIK